MGQWPRDHHIKEALGTFISGLHKDRALFSNGLNENRWRVIRFAQSVAEWLQQRCHRLNHSFEPFRSPICIEQLAHGQPERRCLRVGSLAASIAVQARASAPSRMA